MILLKLISRKTSTFLQNQIKVFSVSRVRFDFFTTQRIFFINSIPSGNLLTITLSLLLFYSPKALLPTFSPSCVSQHAFSIFNLTTTLLAAKFFIDASTDFLSSTSVHASCANSENLSALLDNAFPNDKATALL